MDQIKIQSPYVGPRPFHRGETLYGRDHEVAGLLSTLTANRIVLLHSPSGAGKTSLIQAALVPRLEEREFRVLPIIRVSGTPQQTANRYILSTMLSLEEGQPESDQLPLETLAQMSLADYLARLCPDEHDELVLIFDQFEEVLTLDPTDHPAKQEFFAQLGTALRQHVNYWVLFAIREDYVASLTPYVRAVPTRMKNTFRLDLPGPDAAKQAMQEPAHTVGIDFADAAAEQLCNDLRQMQVQQADGTLAMQHGPHIEPVQLQVVCLRLWHNLPDGATTIATDDITRIGDVNTALAAYYAERVATIAQATGVTERAIRAWVDDQLITDQGIRGQVIKGAGASAGLDNHAIQQLIDAHLVRAEQRRGATWFELAHDRLIEPVQRDNATWREANLSLLQRQAALWEQQRRPDGLLLRGAELDEAEAWAAAHTGPDTISRKDAKMQRSDKQPDNLYSPVPSLTDVEEAFLDTCRKAREREEREWRTRRFMMVAAVVAFVLAIVAAGTAFVAFDARTTAELEANKALKAKVQADNARATTEAERNRADLQAEISFSRQLAAQSVQWQEQNLDLALLLAVQSNIVKSTVESQSALLDGLRILPLRATIYGQADSVLSVAFNPDGTTLASGGRDGTIQLWNVATEQPRGKGWTGHMSPVKSVVFSPDGTTLASVSSDNTIILWDVATGLSRSEMNESISSVESVVFSPDGMTLASGSWNGEIRLWDVATGLPRGKALYGSTNVQSMVFSPDGATLITNGGFGMIPLWDITMGQLRDSVLVGELSNGIPNIVAFSSNGATLASAYNSTIHLWDVATGKSRGILEHGSSVESLAFRPDGRILASVGADGTVQLWNVWTQQLCGTIQWDIATGPLREQSGHRQVTSFAWGITFSPDGKTLASTSENKAAIWLWDVTTEPLCGEMLRGNVSDVWDVWKVPIKRPDRGMGHQCVELPQYPSPSPQRVELPQYPPPSTQRVEAPPPPSVQSLSVNSVAFSPDGDMLASASGDTTILLWDVATGQPRGDPLEGHTDGVKSVAFSLDGATLASASGDDTIRLWDVATGKPRGDPLRGHTADVVSVAFSPDGATLASASGDDTIRLWDVATGKPRGDPLRGHTADVVSVAFSPDGATLASASADDTIRLWDVATGKPRGDPLEGHTDGVVSVAFSPDGATLASASADNTIRLWDVATGQPCGDPLEGHTADVVSVAFSPDGATLASASADRTIRLWYVATGQPIGEPLRGHTDDVRSVMFSSDGATLASAGWDNTIRLWDVSVESWKRRACRAAGRNLTMDEWRRHMGEDPYMKTCPELQLPVQASVVETGDALAQRGDIEGAIKSYKEKLDLDTSLNDDLQQRAQHIYAYALVEEGDRLAQEGNTNKATQTYSQALQFNPILTFSPNLRVKQVYAGALIDEGDKLARVGKIDKATRTFGKAQQLNAKLTLTPTLRAKQVYADALVDQGEELARAGDIVSATLTFSQAIQVDPTLDLATVAPALVEGGEIQARTGEIIIATTTFSLAMQFDPTLALTPTLRAKQVYASALVDEGEDLASVGDIITATAKFSNALHLDPTLALTPTVRANQVYANALIKRGSMYLDQADYERAIQEYDKAIQLNPDNADTYITRGNAYYQMEQYSLAIRDYDMAIAIDSDSIYSYRNRGNAYFKLKQYEQAFDDYEQAIQIDPDDTFSYRYRGRVYFSLSKPDSAFRDYDKAIQIDPDDANVWNTLCWDGSLYGYTAEVMYACEKAVTLAPVHAGIRDSRGLARALTGNFNGAIEDFQYYVKHWVEDPYSSKANELRRRETWIAALERGENPFTEDVLQEMRNE